MFTCPAVRINEVIFFSTRYSFVLWLFFVCGTNVGLCVLAPPLLPFIEAKKAADIPK
jgi:hypothetical protein